MPDQVSDRTKERRFRKAMATQQSVSLERNRDMVGRTLRVLVEGNVVPEKGSGETNSLPFRSVGRSYRDSPEVDGLVFVRNEVAEGTIADVRIVEAMDYDLVGELVRPTPAS
jgi:ribosomal protein S12 methylthiotransferase